MEVFFLLLALLANPAPAEPKLLLAGDSLAVGLTAEFKALAKARGWRAYADGRVGTRVDQWVRWLPKDLATYHPDVVYLSLGTNDATPETDRLYRHPEMVTKIALQVAGAHAKLVWIGPPTLPKRLTRQDAVRTLIRDRVLPYYDSTLFEFERTPDHIHATPKGYRDWMDAIWSWSRVQGAIP